MRQYKTGIKSKNCGRCWVDKLGQKYGRLTFNDIIADTDTMNSKKDWRCDCGNLKSIVIKSVLSGYTKSCGCLNNTPMIKNCDKRKFQKIQLSELYNKEYGDLTIVDNRNRDITFGSEEKVMVRCKCGKTKQIKFGSLVRGYSKSCGHCDDIKLSDRYGKLSVIDTSVIVSPSSNKQIDCRCVCGTVKKIRIDHLVSGESASCGQCAKTANIWWENKDRLTRPDKNYTIEYLDNYFSGSYLKPVHGVSSLNQPITVQCLFCGNNFITRLSWVYGSKIVSCGCISNKISKINTHLGNALATIGCHVQYEHTINNYDYDLLVNNKIVVECHGLRYHSTQIRDNRRLDKLKYHNAVNHAYQYMMVYEDEIKNNLELISKIIAVKAGQMVYKFKIRPKHLKLVVVSNKELVDFYDKYHYIGYTPASINYAILYDEQIIAAISFRNPVRQNIDGIELCRMCINYDYKVSGLWSWVFSKLNIGRTIVSYCDDRLFDGRTYKNLGFIQQIKLKSDYYWVKNNRRHHKSKLRKPVNCAITESELRESEGYYKIYDIGKTKWVYTDGRNCADVATS